MKIRNDWGGLGIYVSWSEMAKEARQGADSPDAFALWIIYPRKERPLFAILMGQGSSLGPPREYSEEPCELIRRPAFPIQTHTYDFFIHPYIYDHVGGAPSPQVKRKRRGQWGTHSEFPSSSGTTVATDVYSFLLSPLPQFLTYLQLTLLDHRINSMNLYRVTVFTKNHCKQRDK